MAFIPNPNLVPITLAVKYNPPTLALFYKINIKDRKKRRYNIFLNQLAFLPNPQEITEQLYCEHKEFLNEKNVEYAQVFRMVELLFHNRQLTPNPIDEVNSYIQSDNELDRSIQFENEQELYYSSYNPKKDVVFDDQCTNLATSKENKRQRIQNFPGDPTSIRLPEQLLQSTNTNSADEQFDVWGSKNKSNLNLSLSGMQQFMEKQGPGAKFTPKPVYKAPTAKSLSPPVQMPTIPATNNLSNRQQQQLKNQMMSNENNLNIANFVEQGNLQGQMFIDDQLYQSPSPTRKATSSKYVQQQINQNQQYYLQQNNNQNIKKPKAGNQKLPQSRMQGNYEEWF